MTRACAKKVVWIVNPYDNLPCEGTRPQRYWLMSEAFVRAGFRVVYWTSDFSHATKKNRVGLGDVPLCSGGIEVNAIPTMPYSKNICFARIHSHRKLAHDFEAWARRVISSDATPVPAIVVASTPPLGLCAAAMRLAKICGAAFICDIQDAWPETFERIVPRWACLLLGLRAAAKRIYRNADAVSTVAAQYVDLAQSYGCRAPMRVFGHCIDAVPCSRTLPKHEKHEDLRLVYVGNMSLSYDLATLIRVVLDLPHVSLVIAGNGPDRPRLEAMVRGTDEKNKIRFLGYLGAEELSRVVRSCDVGVVPMFPESCVGVPGKLADYAAAGLFIVESLGGECREIVEKYGVGIHYTAGDPDSLKKGIQRLATMPRRPSDDFAAAFDARKVMDAFVPWCEELTT